MTLSRRRFLKRTAAAGALLTLGKAGELLAGPRPAVGVQHYTVADQLKKDFEGTLHQIRSIGYEEVEMAGFFGKNPKELRRAFENAGVRCSSIHMFDPLPETETLDRAREIGARYAITALYLLKRTADDKAYMRMAKGLTIDDYRKMADRCNELGELAKSRGVQLGYHNENLEFRPIQGGVGYDEFLRLTDADLVKLELDCGWMVSAGRSPLAYISGHPDRYRLLHVKDFRPQPAPPLYGSWPGESPSPTELGRGQIDYQPIFNLARQSGIEFYYVEQEAPFTDMPVLEALKVDYRYVSQLKW
jgi:sugar phosphate isomerase/epimerase